MTGIQKTITGSVIYSHFRYLCPYHTWLLFNVSLPEEVPAPSDRLLMESGIRHEDEVLRYFQEKYGNECICITGEEGRSKEENIRIRFGQTIAAMSEGKGIIYHGILAPNDRMIKVGNRFHSYRGLPGPAKHFSLHRSWKPWLAWDSRCLSAHFHTGLSTTPSTPVSERHLLVRL